MELFQTIPLDDATDNIASIFLKTVKGKKNITLRFSTRERHFILSCAPRTLKRTLNDFIQNHQCWIKEQAAKVAIKHKTFTANDTMHFQGKIYTIFHSEHYRARISLSDETLNIQSPVTQIDRQIRRFLFKEAANVIATHINAFSKQINVTVNNIAIRDLHSRWGSCSSNGNLSFNWRIILAPPEILFYLCAHEIAHRVHMNHSKEFWDLVYQIDPDFKASRAWLKANGSALFQYG